MNKVRLMALVLFACTIVTAAQAQPKSAFEVATHISNFSNNCAWVTVYSSRPGLPWTSVRALWFRAGDSGTVKAAFSNIGMLQLPAEIRVRAEYMQSRDCHGGVVGEREAEKKGIMPPSGSNYTTDISATINQNSVGFSY